MRLANVELSSGMDADAEGVLYCGHICMVKQNLKNGERVWIGSPDCRVYAGIN